MPSRDSWPQPREGITGVDLSRWWLLSLEEAAAAHREALIAMARHLHTATLVGQPAPVVARIRDHLRHPQPGELAVAAEVMMGRPGPDDRAKGFGLFLGERTEWWHTDEQWAEMQAG